MADVPTYRILVRDLVLAASVGAFAHEHQARQRVRVNVTLDAVEDPTAAADSLGRVISYGRIVAGVRSLVDGRHYNLVETLAARIADLTLADPRARRTVVRVEKLDIFPDVVVGVEIERTA
ncbi:MAG: dihydroneopterin aldolase [Alphaproteobacteria bacterium]|nr:dihydroneopterin aldolase [Alphaproteobacteria bacterium]